MNAETNVGRIKTFFLNGGSFNFVVNFGIQIHS